VWCPFTIFLEPKVLLHLQVLDCVINIEDMICVYNLHVLFRPEFVLKLSFCVVSFMYVPTSVYVCVVIISYCIN